jgi:hypothetical protein
MKNNTLYFFHDFNAHNDFKILFLRQQLGIEGYGIYWFLIESLADSGGVLPLKIVPVLAMQMQTSEAKVTSVINNFDLFVVDDNNFFNTRLIENLKKIDNIKQINSQKGKKSGEARRLTAVQQRLNNSVTSDEQIREDKIRKEEIREDKNKFIEIINYSDVVGENSDVKKNDDEFNEKVKKWRIECSKFLKDEIFKKNFCNKEGLELPTLEELMAQFVIKLNLEADFKNHKALIRHFTNHYMKHKTGKTTYTAFSNANSIIDVNEDMDYDNMQTW